MSKSETQARFDYLVSKVIWPHFKPLGYRKTGNNFRCLHEDGSGKILQFQKSMYYDKDHISFTINLGLYLPNAWPFATGPLFTEPQCIVRRRLGHLKPDSLDTWYGLSASTDTDDLYQMVKQDVTAYALPFLDSYSTHSDILEMVLTKHDPSSTAQVVRVLYASGKAGEAKSYSNKS